MLLPRKWALSLGLLAAAPSLSMAGPLDFLKPGSASKQAAQPAERTNQEVAEEIAKALSKARLEHKDVQIEYKGGVAIISGQIKDAPQRALVTRIVRKVDGVASVENQLELMQKGSPAQDPQVQQAAASQPQEEPSRVDQAVHQGQADKRVQPAAARSNQEVAQKIADSLVTAGLSGYDIEVRYKGGIASLIGSVEDKEQVTRAHQATASVAGVNEVLNRLTVKGKPVDIRQTAAAPHRPQQTPQGVPQQPMPPQGAPGMRGGYPMPQGHPQMPQGHPQMPHGHPQMPHGVAPTAMQAPAGPPGVPPGPPPGAPVPGPGPAPGAAPPQYGHVQPASHHLYNQPNVPPHAWPSYAPYDNSAAVTYPGMYDASAWPYIGPYYPYPQVPLGWRSSQLEWKDGHWSLRFSPRTDRWWWFLNPHNWH